MKKMFIEIGFKEVWVFKRFLWSLCFRLPLYNYKETIWSFIVKKMFIEIRLCNLTHVFKGQVKFAKINVVKFNVSILHKLKMIVFCKCKYINIMSFFNKTEQNLSLFWQNVLFPYMNSSSYLKRYLHVSYMQLLDYLGIHNITYITYFNIQKMKI